MRHYSWTYQGLCETSCAHDKTTENSVLVARYFQYLGNFRKAISWSTPIQIIPIGSWKNEGKKKLMLVKLHSRC